MRRWRCRCECRSRNVAVLVIVDRQRSKAVPTLGERVTGLLTSAFEGPTVALDNALRLRRAEALSVTDDLTQLYNSRYLNQVLRRETKRASRSGRPLSLLFVDLDGFKNVNDNHGHLAGSRGLVEAAEVIRRSRAGNRRRRPVWRRRVRAGTARYGCGRRRGGRRTRPRAYRRASVPGRIGTGDSPDGLDRSRHAA